MTTDAKVALVILLKDHTEINTLTSGRVYYDAEAFKADVGDMAQKAISVLRSGGPEDHGYLRTDYERIDIKCWGDTAREAYRLYSAVKDYLKAFTPRDVSTPDGGVKVYNFSRVAGPLELRNLEDSWPLVWTSWLMKSHSLLTSSSVSGS